MWVIIIICYCGRQQPLGGGVHLHRRRNQRTDFCSCNCKHEVATMLQLRGTLEVIEKNYAEEYKKAGYFAVIFKGVLFGTAIDGKDTGSFTL